MARQKVSGIGGVFFRAENPEALAKWYAHHLGVDEVPGDYDTPAWRPAGGTTVFAPFPADTDYFGDPGQRWMINFRVMDLDAMVAQLVAAGIEVQADGEVHPNGRFARLYDPEGNPVELWEPAGLSRETEEKT